MELGENQIKRYARHILLREVGGEGQAKLLDSKVLVIGAGGLGSPVLLYLAAAGIGTIGVIDDDAVDLSNLQRQVVHATESIGKPKVESAGKTIATINPEVTFIAHNERLTADNALGLVVMAEDRHVVHLGRLDRANRLDQVAVGPGQVFSGARILR